MLENIEDFNTFLTVENGKLKKTIRSTNELEDFWKLDESRRREQ